LRSEVVNTQRGCSIKNPNKPQFITLIGDQIYADATAGFLDPTAKFDRFVQPYYRLYENQHVRSVLRALPLFAMLDDHELSDNWEPVTNNPAKQIELDETRTAGVTWRSCRFKHTETRRQA